MASKYNRPNGKLFGSSATNIGVFGSGQQNETPTTSTDPNTINGLGTHWEEGWNGAVVSQAPYTAPYVEDMNAVNYVNSYNSAYLLQKGIPEYSATEEYHEDSVCTYGGEIWICLQDNTPAGTTPTESAYWHQQTELPAMADKRILVGSVGNTATVVDTSGQGDVEASSSGLNIKANTIVNADVNSSAAIVESKLSLDYPTSNLNTAITNHIGNTSNPHSVTKAQVLSGDPIVNADVDASAAIEESKLDLDYATDTLNTNIGNVSTALGNHTGDKNNPHETEISNLHDVTISSLQDGDVVFYDLLNDTWKNGQPAGGALSTLSDTTISSPTNKQLVQYDYANSKWVNSSDVWDTIEVNDIANINNSTTDITLTASDKRQQILTATDGINITLPSTGIKAGERFFFSWSVLTWAGSLTRAFIFKTGNGSAFKYAWIPYFNYEFTALVDNPNTTSDWMFNASRRIINSSSAMSTYLVGKASPSLTWTANNVASSSSASLITIYRGVWSLRASFAIGCSGTPIANLYLGVLVTPQDGSSGTLYDTYTTEKAYQQYRVYMQATDSGDSLAGLYQKTVLYKNTAISANLRCQYRFGTNANETRTLTTSITAHLIAPITENIT